MDPNTSPESSRPSIPTLEGTVIAGKYELLRLLGQGGMGAVYMARHLQTLKRCAVKLLLSPELGQDQNIVKRFFREAKASGLIESDYIVQIYDSGTDSETGFPYMVMELLLGEDLEQCLRTHGALDPVVAGKIAFQAATGLARAHETGVFHRDIKPANLFLTRRETGEFLVKVLDFGIAKVKMESFTETSHGLTRTGSMLGTPLYMSPEQARGASSIDARSDVWSLGVVMYELLSGRLPYERVSSLGDLMVAIITADIPLLQDKAPWVPPELAEICHRAISRDLDKRFASAAELRDALGQLLPDAASLTGDSVRGVTQEQRAVIAPRLTMTDDGMLRASTTKNGMAVTQSGIQTMAPAPAKRRWLVPVAAAGALVLAVSVAAAFKLGREDSPEPETATTAPPPVVLSVPEPNQQPLSAGNLLRTVELKVDPPDVTVIVDGMKMDVKDGKVTLAGSAGATRKVKLVSGDQEEESLVAITDNGVVPPLLKLAVKRGASQRPATKVSGKQPAEAKPVATKPADKPSDKPADKPPATKPSPQVAKDLGEFE